MSVTHNKFFRICIGLGIIVLLSVISYWFIRKVFSITTIEIAGSGITVVVDEKKIPKNLLFFPSEKIRSDILRENVLLGDVTFTKKFPDTLIIRPVLRKPVAIIRSKERIALIDQEGFVLEYGDQGRALPLFRFENTQLVKGEKIKDANVLLGLQSLESMSYIGLIQFVTEQDSASIHIKTDKTDIYIPQGKDIKDSSATLQTLLAGFRIKGKLPAVIDLRFDKPVVQY